MAKGGNSPGLSRLAGLMKKIAQGQVPSDLILDLADIQANGALQPNSVDVVIAKEDYLVLDGANVHRGDRVLIGWVDNDAVVLGRIREASKVL